jgi:ADP-ribosyl-[dinitrogen reductase] hydrolase
VNDAEQALLRDLDAAIATDPEVYGIELDLFRTAGFVRVAFRLAFWHLVHTTSWRDALIDVASRGGDADTNAAITGALLGARDGLCAIPRAWLDRVLAVSQPGPADWADAHHPRHLLALVEPSGAHPIR